MRRLIRRPPAGTRVRRAPGRDNSGEGRRTRQAHHGNGIVTKTELFTEYASYHADPRNRICHAFGIPLIVLGILGLAHLVRLGPVDLAVVAAIAVLAYYAAIDARGALISLVVFAVLYVIARRLNWEVSLAAFVLGWGFQFFGHKLEGTKPKFFENLVYLAIGPLYIFAEVFGSLVRPKHVT
jgi:uncharacterized membrane protein YGL010W